MHHDINKYQLRLNVWGANSWKQSDQMYIEDNNRTYEQMRFSRQKLPILRGEDLLFINTFKCWEVLNGVLSYVKMLMHKKKSVDGFIRVFELEGWGGNGW